MAIWNERFRIGNGERTTDISAPYVYRSYRDCDIEVTEEIFDEIARKYKIFFETKDLKSIIFKPKDVLPQTTSHYHFLHLQVKFPRNN